MRHGVAELNLDWRISSAGTQARPGRPMHPRMADVLKRKNIDADDWSSRLLTGALFDAADLILTAEARHRASVVTARPNALHRTFTLRQFATLAPAVTPMLASPDAGATLLERARAARSVVPLPPDSADIDDPIGHRGRAYRRCAREIDEAIADLLRPITPY